MKTKLFILLTILLVCPIDNVLAQNSKQMPKNASTVARRWNDYERSKYFGVRIGINASQLFFRGCPALTSSMAGMNLGVVAGWKVTNTAPLFFETGLYYMGRGAYINDDDPKHISMREHNFDIPLLMKYKFSTPAEDLYIQPFFGMYMSFGIGGETRIYDDNPDLRDKHDTFRSGGLRAFDLGLKLGCGMSYRNFYFELAYSLGLLNAASSNFDSDNEHLWNDHLLKYDHFDNHLRNGVLSATIGIDF